MKKKSFIIMLIIAFVISKTADVIVLLNIEGSIVYGMFVFFSFLTWFAAWFFIFVIASIFNIDIYKPDPIVNDDDDDDYEYSYSHSPSSKKNKYDGYDDDDDDFFKSAVIGAITDDPLIGGSIGGSYAGGLFGSELF